MNSSFGCISKAILLMVMVVAYIFVLVKSMVEQDSRTILDVSDYV